jgi:twitching motility protein PilT
MPNLALRRPRGSRGHEFIAELVESTNITSMEDVVFCDVTRGIPTERRAQAMNFEALLKFGVDQGAVAIHLQAGSPPQLRIGGMIRHVEGTPLKAEELRTFLTSIAPKSVSEDLDRSLAAGSTFSAVIGDAGRFRGAMYSHLDGPGLVLKVIPATVRSVEELNLPQAVRQIALANSGLVLVVGPGGSGRTTTLAAMVDIINETTYQKIVTVEAPVEYVHGDKKGLVTQMEVGLNATSFEHGFGMALQQDADVIVIGDLSDGGVARMALSAAEAGKKVLAAMTAPFTASAIARLLELIPSFGRETAESQLAAALEGVVAQRLAKTRDGKLRPAVEILRGGPAISKAIRENRLKDLAYFVEGRQGGMQSLDQHLVELQHAGVISGTETMRLAGNPEAVAEKLRALKQAAVPLDVGLQPAS